MPPQKGRLFLLKIGSDGVGGFTCSGASEYADVAAQRTTSLAINGESVDVTNKDSTNQMRELMAEGGVKSMDVSAEGVFTDDDGQVEVESRVLSGEICDYQLVFEDGRTYEGPFQVTSVEYSGDYNTESTYSLEMESAGDVTVTGSGA